MKSQLLDFISLLYPRVCINCNKGLTTKEQHLCLSCDLSLPKSQYSTNKGELLKKFIFQPKVTGAYAYLDYIKDGIVQKLIHSLKYQRNQKLGVWLGSRLGNEIQQVIKHPIDLIVPIPLHKNRLKIRGYNQSDLIAEGISQIMSIPVGLNVAVRDKQTETQTKKAKISRWESMKSVFRVVNHKMISSKNILVVDDVITTGATLGVFCDEIARHDPSSLTIGAIAAGK